MEFIKKNIVLVIVLGLSLLGTIFLIYMVFIKHSGMSEMMHNVEKMKVDIERLNKSKPAPCDQNLEWINEDKKIFKERCTNLRLVFGHPFLKPLQDFAKKLGTTAPELKVSFEQFWIDCLAKDNEMKSRDILRDFLKKFDTAKLTNALMEFKTDCQKLTSETIEQGEVLSYLLMALGVPRNMSQIKCKQYVGIMQKALVDKLDPPKREVEGSTSAAKEKKDKKDKKDETIVRGKVTLDNSVRSFTFTEYQSRLPVKENIPYIIRHLMLIDDLMNRIKVSGVSRVESLTRIGGLHGSVDKGFLKFRYKLTLIGELENLRKFINNLLNAYKDNRVYLIKDITIEKLAREASKIITSEGSPRSSSSETSGMTPEQLAREMDKPYYERKGYGKPVISASMCKMEIEIDYVIYVASELKRN